MEKLEDRVSDLELDLEGCAKRNSRLEEKILSLTSDNAGLITSKNAILSRR